MNRRYAVLAVCGCLAVAVAFVAYTAMAADRPELQRTATAGRADGIPQPAGPDPARALDASWSQKPVPEKVIGTASPAVRHTGATPWQPEVRRAKGEQRVGGDTCDWAELITALPYTDSGNTCGFTNDYDEVCPYTGSTSPDVAYEYTPGSDVAVDISLCNDGTDYDTKLYVYESSCPGVLVACNEDACSTPQYPNPYVSELIGVMLTGGTTYFIIVDGYGGYCGNYVITVDEGVPPPPRPECPAVGTLFGQQPHMPDESWSFGNADANSGYLVQENFWDVTLPICDIHWWGITAYLDPYMGWTPCVKVPDTYDIIFYQDVGGVPGAVVCTYTDVTPTKVDTGLVYADLFPMYEYSAVLDPCCLLANGWVSIQGVNAGQSCWFMWASSPFGDGDSLQNGAATGYDRGFCLTGEYIPQWGACCDDSTGICNDEVQLINCLPPLRFAANTLCINLVPPCGEITGACCYPDGSCEITTQMGCIGGDWLGPNTTCDMCPCVVPCPPGANIEGETCGADTNGGCNMTVPAFEPINCDETVCGMIWADGGTRDTDWYEVVIAEPMILSWTCKAEFNVVIGYLETTMPGAPTCANITGYLNPYAVGGECEEVVVTTDCVPAGTHWLFVSHQDYYDWPCDSNNDYVATLECVPCVLPTGACCLETGECVPDVNEFECLAMNGDWLGEGTDCGPPNPCPQPQVGDNCGLPIAVTLPADLPYSDLNQYTCGRGNTYDDPNNGTCLWYYDGGEDIIYELTVSDSVDVDVTMDPKGTSWTGIALDDSCPPDDTCIAYDRASSGIRTLNNVHLDPGVYYIMVDTWPSPVCIPDFDLTITPSAGPPPNDDCEDAEPVGDVVDLAFDTTAASFDGSGTCMYSPNIWYCYTATCTGVATISLCDSSYDTKLAVYDGCTCDPLGAELCCNDDSCGLQSECKVPVVEGNQYLIEVGGYSSNTGPGILNISCKAPTPGDNCDDPYVVNLPGDLPFADLGQSTCDRVDDYEYTCMGYYDGGEDMIYQLVVSEKVVVTITLDADTIWGGLGLDDECPLPATDCIATAASSADPDVIEIGLEPGIYYLMVDTFPSPECADFDLTIELVPGACCFGTECSIKTRPECEAAGGYFLGEFTNCGAVEYVASECTNAFEDISGTGEELFLTDDDGESADIGFTFNFYGEDHTDIAVCSNGYLTFGSDWTDYSNDDIPDDYDPNDFIAPLWDDLDPNQGGTVHYQTLGTAPDRRFIAQWTEVPQHNLGDANTFQAVLYEGTNCVEFRYGVFTPESYSGDYTVGIENQDGSDGVAIDPTTLSEGSCVSICPEEPIDPCLLVDIKPGSCPNPFNCKSHGVLPVAVVGEEHFDVTMIDVSTVRLARADGVGGVVAPHEGPPGPHSVFADVATPFYGELCDCHEEEGDGIVDLSMKFKTDEVVPALELNSVPGGVDLELVVTGFLNNGLPFAGRDCIRLVPKRLPLTTFTLSVQSNLPELYVEASPMDVYKDSDGFTNFVRTYVEGQVTLTAPELAAENQPFLRWEIDGVPQAGGQRTVVIDMDSRSEAMLYAVYSDRVVLQGQGP